MHFVLELERLPYPLRDTSKNKSNFLFTIEPHLIGGSKIGIEIGWESEKRSENSKCCCYEHLLLLVIAAINCRFETKWGSQRSSRMSPPARPFICLINKDSLHAIQQQFFFLTSDTIMMLVFFGNIRSVGVVKLVAVIEHVCCASPPLVSFTVTWKS